MKIMYTILLLVGLMMGMSCDKDDTVVDDVGGTGNPPENFDSALVWQVALCAEDTSDFLGMVPLMTDYGVIFSNDYCPTSKALNFHRMYCLDKQTGDLVWSISSNVIRSTSNRGQYKDAMWVYRRGHFIIVDIPSGQVRFDQVLGKFHPRANRIGAHLYFSANHEHSDTTYLMRFSLEDFDLDTIGKLNNGHPAAGKDNFIEPPVLYVPPQGWDSLLIYQNRMVEAQNVIAFNLSQRAFAWHRLGPPLGGSAIKPCLYNTYLVIAGEPAAFCLDVETGDLIWYRDDVKYGGLSQILTDGDLVFINCNSPEMYGLDLQTGITRWRNREVGFPGSQGVLQMYDGWLWANITDAHSCKIMKINPDNGLPVWKYESHNRFHRKGTSYSTGFIIDPELRTFFSSDTYYAMSVELPE